MTALTITDNDGSVSYATGGGGSAGPFAINFVYFDEAEINVSVTDVAGVVTVLSASDYTLINIAADDGYSGGSLTLDVAVVSSTVTIWRELLIEKAENIGTTGKLNVPRLNTQLTRLYAVVQDLRRSLDLAIHAPEEDAGDDFVLPSAADRANQYLGFDTDGGLTTFSGGADQPVSSAMAPVVAAASLAAARTAMGLGAVAVLSLITNAFLADMTGPTLKGRSSGTGAPQDLAASTVLSLIASGSKTIGGLTYQNDVSDATNDLSIAAGGCMDSTGGRWIAISATIKQSDVAWAADNGATPSGALDTGAVGNNDYYIHAIINPTSGVTGILFSLSSTAPTLPGGYTLFRCIGWFKRSGGAIVTFKTYEMDGGGLKFLWLQPTLDINLANTLTTAKRSDALKVPLNLSTEAIVNAAIADASATAVCWIFCPDLTGAVPAFTAAPLYNIASTTAYSGGLTLHVQTDTTGKVAAYASLATVDGYYGVTAGFCWSRRI